MASKTLWSSWPVRRALAPRKGSPWSLSRCLATEAVSKKEGDISSIFASLGSEAEPLPQRFADIKRGLIAGHEEQVAASWCRLLIKLRKEIDIIASAGSSIVPEIAFADIESGADTSAFGDAIRKRGVAVIRGVINQERALQWKQELRDYLAANPHTKAFPKDDPQVFELYWSPSQVKARANTNLLRAQQFVMGFWHSSDPDAVVDTAAPLAYADRLRMRQPGDMGFALGPHIDSGSVERWEPDGYGKGRVYDKVWLGKWEEYDPWESSVRLDAVRDLYNGAGACSMFRMFQGWLSMSETGPGEGTLSVNPLLKEATAYYLLRPFFAPKKTEGSDFLGENNWTLEPDASSLIHGANPGLCQEFNTALHPHLDLERSMIHIPKVYPGDYVVWHCDTIHGVDKRHAGQHDSSVMYIPASPTTRDNLAYIARQRKAFESGAPGCDFPGGIGEGSHVGRPTVDVIAEGGRVALNAMGYHS